MKENGMLLVTDVGNSHTVLGLFEEDALVGRWRVRTGNYHTTDELQMMLAMLLQNAGITADEITGCCISSVVPQLNASLIRMSRRALGVEPIMVGPGVKTGIRLQCDNPKEVGADRIVNSVGALAEHTGPLIIIDFGTATTFDAVTAKNEWIGGVIFPGLQLSVDALFDHCAKLPSIDIAKPAQVIGRDTVSNIQSGITYGYADLVDGIVGRMKKEMEGEAKVIATGGLATVIGEVARSMDVIDPQLTLKGLRAVYRKNTKEVS
jgi:type III pantothenate kinase